MADVRVGIVSWNTAALLDRCLAALPAALGDLDAEVVVVDNASTDGSAEVAARHAGERTRVVVNATNVGYARAMNQALEGTSAAVLVALNPDTEAPPGALAALVACLRDRPDAAVVVPALVHADGRPQHSVHRFPSIPIALALAFLPRRALRGALGRRLALEGAAPPTTRADVDWAIGAVHVVRRAALDGSAPYTERWFMYAEDIELCWRLREQGWATVVEPSVAVAHVGNASGAQAWGDARADRYWRATYELVASMRGAAYARLLAVANVVAVTRWLAAMQIAKVRGRPAAPGRRALVHLLGTHARAVLRPRGAGVPGSPPVTGRVDGGVAR